MSLPVVDPVEPAPAVVHPQSGSAVVTPSSVEADSAVAQLHIGTGVDSIVPVEEAEPPVVDALAVSQLQSGSSVVQLHMGTGVDSIVPVEEMRTGDSMFPDVDTTDPVVVDKPPVVEDTPTVVEAGPVLEAGPAVEVDPAVEVGPADEGGPALEAGPTLEARPDVDAGLPGEVEAPG